MKQNIGIWGLGVVGKSVIRHLYKQGYTLTITDKRAPTHEEQLFLDTHNVTFMSNSELASFLNYNDYIIPSPGINLAPYSQYAFKWLSELDLFYASWQKPIIAVTGTVGKTSVVHLLSSLLKQKALIYATGGNIGTGMLDLIADQEHSHGALLELSSFQLEQCKNFRPDLAIWTNLYPNHLDRHRSIKEYFKAKYTLLANQSTPQQALVPWELKDQILSYNKQQARSFCFFSLYSPHDKGTLRDQDTLYFFHKGYLVRYQQAISEFLIEADKLPSLSYPINWLIIAASFDQLGLPVASIKTEQSLSLPSYRFCELATVKGITFYNDSKATIPQATQAAINSCKDMRIHLFLGGISKGVDRKPFIEDLKNTVVHIWCFGAEAQELWQECSKHRIPATSFATLEEAFWACIMHVKSGDTVLFSPAGASFDLFANYQERGERFTQLVKEFQKRQMHLL